MQKPTHPSLSVIFICLALIWKEQSLHHLCISFSLRTSAKELDMVPDGDSVSFSKCSPFLCSHLTVLMPGLQQKLYSFP